MSTSTTTPTPEVEPAAPPWHRPDGGHLPYVGSAAGDFVVGVEEIGSGRVCLYARDHLLDHHAHIFMDAAEAVEIARRLLNAADESLRTRS